MDDIATLAQESLENSGLKIENFTEVQKDEALVAIQEKIRAIQDQKPVIPGDVSFFSVNFACRFCKVGLNVVAGAGIAAIVVAGVAVAPEALVVVAIAEFFGVGAAAAVVVAAVINGALAGGGIATVEGIIATRCENFGACKQITEGNC